MKKFYLTLLIILLQIQPSLAKPLTFSDCVQELTKNNPELLSITHSKKAAFYQKKIAKAEFNPELNGNVAGNITGTHGESAFFGGNMPSSTNTNDFFAARSNPSTTINGSITLKQNVFAGFAHEAQLEQADATYTESEANLDVTRAKLSAELKTNYANLVYWQRYVRLANKIAKRRQENLGVVKLRYEGGNENKGSYLQAQALYKEALFEQVQSKREVEAAKIALAKTIGRNTLTDLVIEDKMPISFIAKYDLENEIANHPQVLLSQAQRKNAEASLKSARSGLYPTIDLSSQVGGSDGNSRHDTEEYAIGLDVNIPIFTFGRTKNQIQKASADLDAAKANELSIYQTVRSNITSTHALMLSARDKMAIQKDLSEASAVRAEIGRHKYNIGLLDFENWDIIETELINYQKSELLSEKEKVVAEANWEDAIGENIFINM